MTGLLPIGTYANLILNRLRNERLLREENQIPHKQDRGPNAGNAEHDGGEDQRGEVANTRIGKSPAVLWDGGVRQELPGSYRTAMTALGRKGCAVFLARSTAQTGRKIRLRQTVVPHEAKGSTKLRFRIRKLYYVAVSW